MLAAPQAVERPWPRRPAKAKPPHEGSTRGQVPVLRLGKLLLLGLLRALTVIEGVDAAREGLLAVRQDLHLLHQGGEDRQGHCDGFAAPDVDGQMSGFHGASPLGFRDELCGDPPPRGGCDGRFVLRGCAPPVVDLAFVGLAFRHAQSPAA